LTKSWWQKIENVVGRVGLLERGLRVYV